MSAKPGLGAWLLFLILGVVLVACSRGGNPAANPVDPFAGPDVPATGAAASVPESVSPPPPAAGRSPASSAPVAAGQPLSPPVTMTATARRDGEQLVISGHTNLPPRARLELEAMAEGYIGGSDTDETEVEPDGRFEAMFSMRDVEDTRIWVLMRFDPTRPQTDLVRSGSGPQGQHLQGDLVQILKDKRIALQVLAVDWADQVTAHGVDGPRPAAWMPAAELRMEPPAVRQEGAVLLLSGQTNLPVGSRVEIDLGVTDQILYGDWGVMAFVAPDGTFQAKLNMEDLDSTRVRLTVKFDPGDRHNTHTQALFGPKGEQMTGELVLSTGTARHGEITVRFNYRRP